MTNFPGPPVRTDFPQVGKQGLFSRPWVQWFQAITTRFNAIPPAVTGSRGGNSALASLLTTLDAQGIITDETTP